MQLMESNLLPIKKSMFFTKNPAMEMDVPVPHLGIEGSAADAAVQVNIPGTVLPEVLPRRTLW